MEENKIQNELEKLKEEIIAKINPAGRKKKQLEWGSAVVTGLLALLTAVSVVQAVSAASILTKINGGQAGPVSTSSVPSNVSDLPDMVGGC
ncbi:hypothetical protein C4569_02045 [Candidatus Parcubacteria bacterium]|nr:MAG: hypothetical protein C4569_02045 [Candidatus Parcubacteria bacterium]